MLKHYKKIGATVLTVAMFAGVLSGCGGTSVGKSSGSGKAVTVTVMQQNAQDYVYFTKIGKEFTKLHPNVTIKYIGVPYDNFDTKLQTMIASGTQPDVTTHVQLMGFMDYYNKGLLTDLTPYIKKYHFDYKKDNIPQSTMSMAVVNGKTYGIPLNSFTTVLLYNKDMFDKAGIPYPTSNYNDKTWTFDKMVEIAKKLSSGSGQSANYGLYWGWDGGGAMQDPDYFNASLFQTGATKTGIATSNNLAQDSVINAYQRIADLTYKDKVMPSPAYVKALGGSDPFLSGKIAMEVQGSWALAGVNDVSFKVGVAAVPVGPNSKVRAVQYTDPYFILKGSKCADEAFQYLAFLAQTDNQIKMVQESGGCPPANTAALKAYYKNFKTIDAADLKSVIEGSYNYAEEDEEHMIVGSGEIHNLLSNELSPVNNGTKTAKSVCVPLQAKLNAELKSINSKKS